MVDTAQELQKKEKSQKLKHEVTIAPNPSWSTKWARLLSTMEHLEVLPPLITSKVKEEIKQ
jgi:hypothetical protein